MTDRMADALGLYGSTVESQPTASEPELAQ